MFQRLKGAIDSTIAAEQARQKAATDNVRRADSSVRRSSSLRNERGEGSPSRRPPRTKPKDSTPTDTTRGPDPSEFESAFVIDDDSEAPSRVGTPAITEKSENAAENVNATSSDGGGEKAVEPAESPSTELPVEVRSKLRKLEKLESRYQELLRSYRIAHARAISIEPFEKALKENTPLTSIGDPGAMIEYLNQINLRGDMVMDELKRVTADRDDYKKKFELAEKEATESKENLKGQSGGEATATVNGSKPAEKTKAAPEDKESSEDFFNYDDELSQLQSQLEEKTTENEDLKAAVERLKGDVSAAEAASQELHAKLETTSAELTKSKADLGQATTELEKANADLTRANSELDKVQTELDATKSTAKEAASKLKEVKADLEESEEWQKQTSKKLKDSEKLVKKLESDAKSLRDNIGVLEKEKKDAEVSLESTKELLAKAEASATKQSEQSTQAPPQPTESTPAAAASTGAKKKNKKKKKGGAGGASAAAAATSDVKEEEVKSDPTTPITASLPVSDELQKEIDKLKEELASRDAQIERLQNKKKTEDDLREEIETLSENLLNIGQEHVEAKDKIKQLQTEKTALQEKLAALEKELEAKNTEIKNLGNIDAEFKSLTAEYDEIKSKTATLEKDLGAAQQLAAARYKDLTDLKDVLQKAQPELRSLRQENASLKTAKEELTSKVGEVRRLEAREKDLRGDIASFKKQAAERDSEVKNLQEKLSQETNGRSKAEDQNRVAQRDLRKAEAEKIELSAAAEKATWQLNKVEEEATKMRNRVQELDTELSKLKTDSQVLREELELKTSQYVNAQGLVGSMRDQSSEMAMQLKEAKDQIESLEEELADVQRLLAERTREGETMRRLLSDVDGRADSKVREMRERMEAAIEERDRLEEESSTTGRRRAREIEELKSKSRDLERELKRAVDDRDELVHAQKEWRSRRDDLEKTTERASQEVVEVRAAMGELRNALDQSEKQARDTERAKTDLRRMLDEANQRYEKLQRSQKAAVEELQSMKGKVSSRSRLTDSVSPSSRSSVDFSVRAESPSNGNWAGTGSGANAGMMDYVYLKTILLQFLEQKDKRLQSQLVPVLGKLLHFDQKDTQKWNAAIAAR